MLCEALDRIIMYDCDEVFEVIVSDNHSSDGTSEVIPEKYKNFAKLKMTKPASPCGPLLNWEYALSLASGTHVHWHWSDDYLCGPFYASAVQLMKSQHVDVVISAVKIVSEDGFEPVCYSQGFIRSDDGITALKKLFIERTLPVSPAACILPIESARKHFYTEIPRVGDYDPIKYAMGTDALMIAGSLLDRDKVSYLEKPYFCFRSHSTSITNVHSSALKSYKVAFEWFIRKERIKIPLRLRRQMLGIVTCNALENKYSLAFVSGKFIEFSKSVTYKINRFIYTLIFPKKLAKK